MTLRVVSVCRSLPTPDDPSSGIFVLNRLAGMARHADVRVLQPVPYFPAVKPLPAWARQGARTTGSLRVETAPMLYLPGLLKTLDAGWLARSIEHSIGEQRRRGGLDVIDAHFGYPEGTACVRIGKRLGIPTFVTVRGFENEYLQMPNLRPKVLEALHGATGLICVSHFLKDLVLREGVPEDRVRVVHNAIAREVFKPGDRIAACHELGLAGGAPLVVSVGHLVSRKRHHVLVEAFVRLREAHPDAVLAIIGAESFETAYPGQLRELVARVAPGDAVRFIGNVPQAEVVRWLQAADVFALGTAREGCCNAVLEALAVGTPVVTTPAGDNARFVRDGINGYIVPVDDAPAMAQRLIDTVGRGHWDAQAISTGLDVGDWARVGREVLEFFAERRAA